MVTKEEKQEAKQMEQALIVSRITDLRSQYKAELRERAKVTRRPAPPVSVGIL